MKNSQSSQKIEREQMSLGGTLIISLFAILFGLGGMIEGMKFVDNICAEHGEFLGLDCA